MRTVQLVEGEYYHIYNRGTDGRLIACDRYDSDRFLESLLLFNDERLCGSIFEQTREVIDLRKMEKRPLVEIICYCLNPNHFHLVLRQVAKNGIAKLMHRHGTGYTNYFNEKYKRKGNLFQGTYKAVHANDNDYLLHLSVYVNINDKVHKIYGSSSGLVRSSWEEYIRGVGGHGLCEKDIILGQFAGIEEYKQFALGELDASWEAKLDKKERDALGVDDEEKD